MNIHGRSESVTKNKHFDPFRWGDVALPLASASYGYPAHKAGLCSFTVYAKTAAGLSEVSSPKEKPSLTAL